MVDSLVIDNTVELLEGGVASSAPQCPGAIFQLGPSPDFGSPQPISAIIGSLLLDGERPIGDRFSNRTFVLPIVITGTSRLNLAAARELVLSTINQEKWSLTWRRDSGLNLVFDCVRANAATIIWDIKADRQNIGVMTITFQALPFGHSDTPQTLAFQGTVIGSPPIYTAQTLDNFTTAYGQDTNGGMPVTPGQTVNVSALFLSGSTSRNCYVGAAFFKSDGTYISFLAGSATADVSSGFTNVTGSVTAPSLAAFAVMQVQVNSTSANEKHYVNNPSMKIGAGNNFLTLNLNTFANNAKSWCYTTNFSPVGYNTNPAFIYTGYFGSMVLQSSAGGNVAAYHTGLSVPKWAWTMSTGAMSGSDSGHWAPVWPDPGSDVAAPVWQSNFSAVDFTAGTGVNQLTALQHWVGVGTSSWYNNWKSGNLTLAYVITDATGNTVSFGTNVYVYNSANYLKPNWKLVSVSIPAASGAFDWTNVVSVSIGVSNFGGTHMQYADLYLNFLQATPPTTIPPTPVSTRGAIFSLTGIIGTAHAPLSLTSSSSPRSDSGCGTNTTTTVTDAHAVSTDLGADISGGSIPVGAYITAVNVGVGYTISAAATATAGSLTFILSGFNYNTLLIHRPNPDAPSNLTPFVQVNNPAGYGDLPNGATAYPVLSQTAGQTADFDGTYSIVLTNFTWNTPTAVRTVVVTVNQIEYTGGPTHYQSVSRTFIPNNDAVNGFITIGELTLPNMELPASNTQAYYTVIVSDTNTADRFYDCIFIDTMGQTVLINIPPSRVDTGCATTNASITVTDPSAIGSDQGKAITGSGIPAGNWIAAVNPGVGYTLGIAATATASALTFTIISAEYNAYSTFFIDAPDATHDIGVISGSASDKTAASSVLDNTFVSGGPLTVDPGGEILLCYSLSGAPGLTAVYFPAWWLDRLA